MLDKHFLTGFSKIQGHFLFVQNEKKIWFIKVFSWLKYLKWIIKSQLFQYFQLKATGRRTRKIFIVRSIKQSIANIKTQSPRGALWKLLQISQENTFIGAFFQKCWRPRSATLLKKRFRHKCFSTNFVKKNLRASFSIEHLQWLLLFSKHICFKQTRMHQLNKIFYYYGKDLQNYARLFELFLTQRMDQFHFKYLWKEQNKIMSSNEIRN